MTVDPFAQTSADVARSCSEAHPGYELIGFGEVGVPFFELRIVAEVLERKPINPFDEFILRAVATGVRDVTTMEKLLGLDRHVLETSLVTLIASDSLRGTGDSEEVAITELGSESLEKASKVHVQTTQLRVVFDPLLKDVIEPFGDFLQPKELSEEGAREVGVPAALVPELHQLEIGDVERVIRRVGGGIAQERDVLALRSMRRFRVYRPAVALVFRAKEAGDVVVDVAFDGHLSERHSLALAEFGLRDKLVAGQVGRNRITDRLLGLQKAKVKPKSGTEKTVPPWELPGKLEAILDASRERLILITPGLQTASLNKAVMEKLEACVKRGASVHIGWGYDEGAVKRSDSEAVKSLDRLASQHPNLNVRQLSGKNDNVLISDSSVMIASDFPWLSNRGDTARILGDERGLAITDPTYVNARAEQWISRLTARARSLRIS